MSTFRDVSSLPPDALRSETIDSVNSGKNRDAEECKCGDADVPGQVFADEKRNKLPGLLNVNQQLIEENELMRQCIVRLMENADLRSMNALTMVMSQTDERLRNFLSESLTGSNARDKATTSDARYNTQPHQLPTSHHVTNEPGSYGSSFKEIRLSELDDEPVAMVTSGPNMKNSNRYTQHTSQNIESPNTTSSFQSYGKSFNEINLSDLEYDAHLNRTSPMQSQKYSKASNNSYGKSFQKISLRELDEAPELISPRQTKLEKVKSPRSPRSSLSNSPRQAVLQPPMRFGVGTSPYRKSSVSPVPQKSSKSPSPQTSNLKSQVNKRRNRSRRNTSSPYYSEHQSLSRAPTISSSLKQRPMSSPLTRGHVQFERTNKLRYPDDNAPYSLNVQRDTDVSLPELLKQLLEAEKYRACRRCTRQFCIDCTNNTCRCHPNPISGIVNERRLNVSRESYSHDSLDTGQSFDPTSGERISFVGETSKEGTNSQVNRWANVSKPIPTINITPCPIFCSTKIHQNGDEDELCISRGTPQIGTDFWEQSTRKYEPIMTNVTERQSNNHPETSTLTSACFQPLVQNQRKPTSNDYDHDQTTTTNADDFNRTLVVSERVNPVTRNEDNSLASQNRNIDQTLISKNKGTQNIGTDIKQQPHGIRPNFDQNTERRPNTDVALTSQQTQQSLQPNQAETQPIRNNEMRSTNIVTKEYVNSVARQPNAEMVTRTTQNQSRNIDQPQIPNIERSTNNALVYQNEVKPKTNEPAVDLKVVEEQQYVTRERATFDQYVGPPTINKDMVGKTAKQYHQTTSNVIGSPMAFSTPNYQTEQKRAHTQKENLQRGYSKDTKATTSRNVTESQQSTSHTMTSDSGSYGVSFKEVRFSELAEEPVTMTTNTPNIMHSNSYTAPTPDYGSPNMASLQSYGKSFKEVNLGDLIDVTHSTASNGTRIKTNQRTSLSQNKVDSNAPFGQHASLSPTKTGPAMATTGQRFNQPQSNVIDSPIAFSTPKDTPDQKMTQHFQKERILGNNSKGTPTTSGNIQQMTESHPSTSYTIRSDSGSYGVSFKEVRLSELAADPVTRTTNTTNIIHSNSYTAPAPDYGLQNNVANQSYGKSFKEVNLSDLNDGPYLTGTRVRTNQHPSLFKSKEDSDTTVHQSLDTRTTNKGIGIVKTDPKFNQTQTEAIGRPLAFSTPKDIPHQKMARHTRKETPPNIQTTLKPLKLLATSAVEQAGANDSTQKQQSGVAEADGNSTNGVHAAKDKTDQEAQDGVLPKGELKSALPISENDGEIDKIDVLAKTMRFTGTAKAKYVLHRAIDTLLGYKPNLPYTVSVLQAADNPNTRLVGEISFQLDRRILEFVFDGIEEKKGKRRSRYYGYSVASILQLIDKEVKYADNNTEINKILRQRLEDILKKLQSLGYKMEHHAEFAQDMVNQFGLLNGEPERGSLEYLGMKEPVILRVVLGQTLHGEDLDSMLVILDCLLYMAYHDRRPVFVW